MSDLGNILRGNFWSSIWSRITGATSKTTPIDADSVCMVDSAESNVVKRLTWANLKATLKTYFDTLYGAPEVSPIVIVFGACTYSAAGAGTWVANYVAIGLSSVTGISNSTHNDADEFTIAIRAPVGTYKMRVHYAKDSDCGKFDTYMDASNLGNTDTYGTVDMAVVEYTGLSLGGSHSIKIKVNGKHASSSNHYVRIHAISLTRTA